MKDEANLIPEEVLIVQRRHNLKDFYKKIRICILCGNKYGDDTTFYHENRTCPDCIAKLNIENRIQRKNISQNPQNRKI